MRRRFQRRGRKMFRGRKRRGGTKRKMTQWGGAQKFHSRYPGGKNVTQVPYPQTYFTKHPYFISDRITTVSEYDVLVFQPNSLFDIDAVGGDVGYASVLNLQYKRYCVLGYAWTVTITNLHTTSLIFNVLHWPTSDVPVDLDEIQYRPGNKQLLIAPQGGAGAVKTMHGYVNIQGLTGVEVWNEKDFWGVGTADPARQTFMFVAVAAADGGITPYEYEFRIQMHMYVKWFNRDASGEPVGSFEAAIPASKVDLVKKLEHQLTDLKLSLPAAKRRKTSFKFVPVVEMEEKEEEMVEIEGL